MGLPVIDTEVSHTFPFTAVVFFSPLFTTLLAEVFFILPLLLRSLFTAFFTVVVYFHREKNLCHNTIPFPVDNNNGKESREKTTKKKRQDKKPLLAG